MNRILVPIDGSPKSLIALEHIKTTFSPKAFEIVLMMVHENLMMITDKEAIQQIQDELDSPAGNHRKESGAIFCRSKNRHRKTGAANRGVCSGNRRQHDRHHEIHEGEPQQYYRHDRFRILSDMPDANVLVVQERARNMKEEYRGMIYRNVESTVNLRGALSLKQSECLLPSVEGDVIYRIHVTRGRVRFFIDPTIRRPGSGSSAGERR